MKFTPARQAKAGIFALAALATVLLGVPLLAVISLFVLAGVLWATEISKRES